MPSYICQKAHMDKKARPTSTVRLLSSFIEMTSAMEIVENYGFRFGNKGKMVSVPCYSEQNGYYDGTVDIYYDDKLVIDSCDTELRDWY